MEWTGAAAAGGVGIHVESEAFSGNEDVPSPGFKECCARGKPRPRGRERIQRNKSKKSGNEGRYPTHFLKGLKLILLA